MGWSMSKKAADTLEVIENACRASTGSSNAWKDGRDVECFFEMREKDAGDEDSGVDGDICRTTAPGMARAVGKFAIDDEGKIVKAPLAARREGRRAMSAASRARDAARRAKKGAPPPPFAEGRRSARREVSFCGAFGCDPYDPIFIMLACMAARKRQNGRS